MAEANAGFSLLRDVDVQLSVELGRTNMKLADILALSEDSVVMLDRLTDEPLNVLVNGKLIARAEIISEDGRFGMRIVDIANGAQGAGAGPDAGRGPGTVPSAEAA